MDYLAEFIELLEDDWREISIRGDSVDLSDGTEIKTVDSLDLSKGRWTSYHKAITLLPDGRYFEWEYALGNTENQENEGPAEYGKPHLVEVTPREVVITKTVWDAVVPVP